MGYEIMIENEGRGVVVKWSDVASAKEILAINDEIYAEGRAAKLRYQIWDFSKAVKGKGPDISFEQVRLFAMQDGQAGNQTPGMLIALVGKEEYFAGMETLYGIYAEVWAENVKYKIFEGMAEARAWVADECPE